MNGPAEEGRAAPVSGPHLAESLFAVALSQDEYIVYSPRRGALVANGALVNALADAGGQSEAPSTCLDLPTLNLLQAADLVERPGKQPSADRQTAKALRVKVVLEPGALSACHGCRDKPERLGRASLQGDVAGTREALLRTLGAAAGAGRSDITLSVVMGCRTHPPRALATELLMLAREAACAKCLALTTVARFAGTVGQDTLQADDAAWAKAIFDRVIVELPSLAGQSLESTEEYGGWHDALTSLDQVAVPYEVGFSVALEDLGRLPHLLRTIALRHTPLAIELDPPFRKEPWEASPPGPVLEFLEAFRASRRATAGLGIPVTVRGAEPGESRGFCGAAENELCITDGGTVRTCHPGPLRDEVSLLLHSATAQDADRFGQPGVCQECFAQATCAGPCPGAALGGAGRRGFPGSLRCHVIREVTKERLLELIADSGGLYWCAQDRRSPPDSGAEG